MDRLRTNDSRVLDACTAALNEGRVIVVPTSRWYMFAARADIDTTAPTIFRLKRRAPDKSLLLISPSREWAASAFVFTEAAQRLANAFWPGDLSLRLLWQDSTKGFPAVGVPVGLVGVTSGWLGQLAAYIGAPLVSTSVNFSGTPAEGGTQPRFAFEQVLQMLDAHPDASSVKIAVDGGVCPLVDATAIVDCSGPKVPVLERPGMVHVDALRYVSPDLDLSRVRRDTAGFTP